MKIFGKTPDDSWIGNSQDCYVGYSTDDNIRYKASSGGLITQLLLFALDEGIIDGALVTRMRTDNPFEPEPFIAREKGEITAAAQSKYCPVPANLALQQVLGSSDHERIAVVGLPCHIQGIRQAELINSELRQKVALHIALTCNHTPSFRATEFILKEMKIRADDVARLSYRGKGWPGAMTVELEGGRIVTRSLRDYWVSGFGQFFVPHRCSLCCDHTGELADISFADAWLSGIQDTDNLGTSIVIVRSDAGGEILNAAHARGKVKLEPVERYAVKQSQKKALLFKKRDLRARLALSALLNKKTPLYCGASLSDPTLSAYLRAIHFYSKIGLASRQSLWGILALYPRSLRLLHNIRN